MRSKRVMGTEKVSRGARKVVSLVGAGCALIALGCGAGSTTGDAAAGDIAGDIAEDTPLEASVDSEVQALCVRNSDCDDARFCNGPERCAPGDMEADARGCAPAAMPACRSNEVCNESMQRCAANPDAGDGEGPVECDRDNDGVRAATPECGGADCDDNDRDRYPGNPERCGSDPATMRHDEDCNPCTVAGVSPDGDGDADGFVRDQCRNPFPEGSTAAPMGCDPRAVALDTSARVVTGVDCDDVNRSRNPNAPEVCGNGVDDNCNGSIDESMLVTVYRDRDGDGFGNPMERLEGQTSCPPPTGYVTDNSDCDDGPSGAFTYPGAVEICDRVTNDCSARTTGRADRPEEDRDNDGFASIGAACVGRGETTSATAMPKTDCDDTRSQVSPGAPEVCDGLDNDCSSGTNEEGEQASCAAGLECHSGRCGFIDTVVSRDNATCALTRQRELVCWGGDTGESGWLAGTRPIPPPKSHFLYDWSGLAIAQFVPANSSACAVTVGGDVYCGGENVQGMLGVPGVSTLTRPRYVAGLPRVVSVGLGNQHTCAATEAGDVYCWGSNLNARLGNNDTSGSAVPVVVPRLARVQKIAVGTNHSCALDADGAVHCWGLNDRGAVGVGDTAAHVGPLRVALPEPAHSIDANSQTTCAVLRDGTVACWGYNHLGQAGVAGGANVLVPTRVAGISGALEVSVGFEHACAVVSGPPGATPGVVCWGSNASRQRGVATTTAAPNAVPGVDDVVHISSGARHTCALRGDGSVRCWGDNEFGQANPNAAVGTRSPDRTPEVVDVPGALPAQLALNLGNGCVRRVDGRVYCSGAASSFVLGSSSIPNSSSMLRVRPLWDAASLALGLAHACVVRSDQTVWCWGAGNSAGQLGDGTTVGHVAPARVTGLAGAVQVSAASNNACARLNDGGVRCWGQVGTLGNDAPGSSGVQSSPAVTVGLPFVEQLASMEQGVCARDRERSVWCWGRNNDGQVGDGVPTAAYARVPVRVLREPLMGEAGNQRLTGVAQIFAGGNHACALQDGGSLYCWGSNDNGTLLLTSSTMPSPVRNSPVGVRRVTISVSHMAFSGNVSMAFSAGASTSLFSWGINSTSTTSALLLRDPTMTETSTVTVPAPVTPNRMAPSQVLTPRDVAIGPNAGFAYTVAGDLVGWGSNSSGQLGAGSFDTPIREPVPVLFREDP